MIQEPQSYYCICGCGAVVLEYWGDNGDDGISLSIWEKRNSKSYPILDRLKDAWRILRVGYPYADDIILSNKDAAKLGTVLQCIAYKEKVSDE